MSNRSLVSSSAIRSVGYQNGTLEIEFADGSVYQYTGLMSAPSKGHYFNENIKDKYQANKI